MTDHPITPPPELVAQWVEYAGLVGINEHQLVHLATQAARWGADQQLEQDAKWLDTSALFSHSLTITPSGDALRQAMRPKPPSLKEQALALVEQHEDGWRPSPKDWDTIRRALEALPQ